MASILVKRLKQTTLNNIEGPESKTVRALIAAGETLIGKQGIDGVALHEIAYAAGQANKYAVQYHFKNINGLIDAIFTIRLRAERERRQQLLAIARQRERLNDMRTIMEILFVPTAEQVDADNNHSYARFLMAFLIHPDYGYTQHPAIHPAEDDPLYELNKIIAAKTQLPAKQAVRRLGMQSYAFIGHLLERDNDAAKHKTVPSLTRVVDDALSVITAAMTHN